MMIGSFDLHRLVALMIMHGPCHGKKHEKKFTIDPDTKMEDRWNYLKVCLACEGVQCMLCQPRSCQCQNDE